MANTSKPLSLRPLKFKDAVAALLKAKPEPKKTKVRKSGKPNGTGRTPA